MTDDQTTLRTVFADIRIEMDRDLPRGTALAIGRGVVIITFNPPYKGAPDGTHIRVLSIEDLAQAMATARRVIDA